MDSFEGFLRDPVTLHDYQYAQNSPVLFTDPSGNFSLHISLQSFVIGVAIIGVVAKLAYDHFQGQDNGPKNAGGDFYDCAKNVGLTPVTATAGQRSGKKFIKELRIGFNYDAPSPTVVL